MDQQLQARSPTVFGHYMSDVLTHLGLSRIRTSGRIDGRMDGARTVKIDGINVKDLLHKIPSGGHTIQIGNGAIFSFVMQNPVPPPTRRPTR